MIHILNQKSQKGEVNLSDFGIEKDTMNVIQSMESCFYHSLFLFLLIFFSFGILAVILFFLYFNFYNDKTYLFIIIFVNQKSSKYNNYNKNKQRHCFLDFQLEQYYLFLFTRHLMILWK